MNKKNIYTLLQCYKRHRGWGRFFFGNTRGIKELTKLYHTIPDGELSEATLDKLNQLINLRAQRLQNRSDNYNTPKGLKKLTNTIYTDLLQQVTAAKLEYKPTAYTDPLNPSNNIIKRQLLVINADEYFDAITLFNHLKINMSLVNPRTQQLFDEESLKVLRTHPLIGRRFVSFERFLESVSTGCENRLVEHGINPLDDPLFMEKLVTLYLGKSLKRVVFYQFLNDLYAVIQKVIQIKSGFSIEDESSFKHTERFSWMCKIIRIQDYFSFESIPSAMFWQFVQKEFDRVYCTRVKDSLRGTRSVLDALKAFDKQPESYVNQAGFHDNIYYSGKFGTEYVVRMPEITGHQRGLQGLKNIVANFKGVFLNAFRYDLLSKLFDSLDAPGICVGEKTRAIAAWSGSLLEREPGSTLPSIHELFAGYQSEITKSEESKRSLITGPAAVAFIWKRHANEQFTYQDRDGQQRTSQLTKDLIIYYLKTYMGDDDLLETDVPEIFQSEATTHSLVF